MEYGLEPSLTLYAGGLGILAGDYMKAAGEQRVPVTGIGLCWDEGYSAQTIGKDGKVTNHFPATPRSNLEEVNVEVTVDVRGESVPLRVYRVRHPSQCSLFLLEPKQSKDRWITRRLYGGGTEDRIAQEIVLGVGGVRLLRALAKPVDVYHFNEGHAVFAAHELLRERMSAGETFASAREAVRKEVVFTTHTPVAAGNESHPIELLLRMGANLHLTAEQLRELGGAPYSMTVAALRLCRRANAVAERHAETARSMWKDVDGSAQIIGITNGVHCETWQDARIRAATVRDKPLPQRRTEIRAAHRRMKTELLDDIHQRTGIKLNPDALLVGFARRAATYKRAHLIFSDEARIGRLLDTRRLQLVFSGKAHPNDTEGKALIEKVVAAARRWPGAVVFLENYDMTIGALMTRGCDVWLNNPVPPLEASGTSGMKAAMNGVLNLSIADGWWPEAGEHGKTGWRSGAERPETLPEDLANQRDREALYDLLENEVLPRYEAAADPWCDMMLSSVEASEWRFSATRMLEDYYNQMYGALS
jgi:starch phosphorylase